MFNKKIFCLLSVLCVLSVDAQAQTAPVSVARVEMANVANPAVNDFNLTLYVHSQSSVSQWKLGFYMPYTFKKVGNWNPNLSLQICEQDQAATCQSLNYDNESAGWTTLLSVDSTSSFATLKPNTDYIITAEHNGMGRPRNYASFPQNFFIKVGERVIDLPTTAAIYHVNDYDQTSINQQVAAHVNDNWANSLAKPSVTPLVIPALVQETALKGQFSLGAGIVIHNHLNSANNDIADAYQQALAMDKGLTAAIDRQASVTGIVIQKMANPQAIHNDPEGYRLVIDAKRILVEASTDTGAFYALQTLRQLWAQSTVLRGVSIVDYPRFKYRGVALDTARHFFEVSDVERLINIMAFQKLNTLHIHFADDEGFRIGLAKYPSLATIGDERGFNHVIVPQLFKQANLDVLSSQASAYVTASEVYRGTYSENDLLTLIGYANARHITIIPEVDLPGHARALVKALPDAFVDPNDQSNFASVQGYSDNVIPVCTYGTAQGAQFSDTINDILTSVANVFDHQTTVYAVPQEMSVGGDEVSGDAWSKDSSCQGAWANLSALGKAQYFFKQVSEREPGLKLSGWQQLVQNDDTSLATQRVPAAQVGHVWVWNSASPGIPQAASLATNGYPTVLAFSDQLYFDLTYTPDQQELGQYWATSYADTHAALTSASSATMAIAQTTLPQNIVGVEGALWSENLVTFDDLMYMANPKMAGLAEAAWSASSITNQSGRVDWQSLTARLGNGQSGFLATLNQLFGVQYRGYPNGIAKELPQS